jgi:hypothetical protein
MTELKTKVTEQTVDGFLGKIDSETVRDDCKMIIKLMKKVTGKPPKMWGTSIVGFDQYHYKYDSGHEGDMCVVGFSPRKANLSLYVSLGAPGQEQLLKKLGKHKAAKGCLYVKKLEDIDLEVLESIIRNCVEHVKKKYPVKK